MIKKHKKLMALLLASVLSVSMLAACGGSSEPAATTPATEQPAVQQPAQEQQVGTTSEVGEEGQFDVEVTDAGWTAAGYTFGPDTPREISMWIVTRAAEPNPDNKIHQKIKDELGVTLKMELTTTDDQLMRIGTMLAGGD
ncbi:MAG: hypothetical protein LBI54_03020, partial [Lachnospiraceae bacterium]|nr:hypothetical protein [Lachnospiraceae bacterium]